jgi:hypothetical protein
MAIIRENIIGSISGRVGDFIYRTRNGKLVKYKRPFNQKVSRSNAAESARNSFSLIVKFASCINSFPYLQEIWKQAKVPGSTHYQRMIKYNSQNAEQRGISVKNVIAPPGISINIEELVLTPLAVSFIVTADSLKLKKLFSVPRLFHLIFYFYSPKVKNKPAYNFSGMTVQNDQKHLRGTNEFNVNLSAEIASSLKSYKNVLVFISLSMLKTENEKVYWTSTFAENIRIQI